MCCGRRRRGAKQAARYAVEKALNAPKAFGLSADDTLIAQQLAAQGLGYKAIAGRIGVTEKAVRAALG